MNRFMVCVKTFQVIRRTDEVYRTRSQSERLRVQVFRSSYNVKRSVTSISPLVQFDIWWKSKNTPCKKMHCSVFVFFKIIFLASKFNFQLQVEACN